MYGIAPIFAHPNFRFWLKADIQSPKIDFRFTPNTGHSDTDSEFERITADLPPTPDVPGTSS